jgi:hypothetical protein
VDPSQVGNSWLTQLLGLGSWSGSQAAQAGAQSGSGQAGNSWLAQLLGPGSWTDQQAVVDGNIPISELFGSNTQQLSESEHLTIAELGSYTDAEQLPSLVAQQLVDGFQYEGWDVSTAADALAMIDADGVTVKQITVDATGTLYTHLEFYMGDTEVGYIYEEGALRRVAVVSDQDIYPEEELEPGRMDLGSEQEMDPADRAHMNRRPS